MRRRSLLVLLTLLAAAAGGACTTGSSSEGGLGSTARVRLIEEVDGATGLQGKGVIDFSRDELALSVTSPAEQAAVETRYFGPTGYFERDEGGWFSNGVVAGEKGSATLTLIYGAGEPGGGLEYLRQLDPTTRRVGRENVRGSPATRWQGTVDTRLIDQTSRTIGVDMWVDQLGRVLRLRLDDRQLRTYEFYDFGVPVDVERPALAET